MINKLLQLPVQSVKNGYSYDKQLRKYTCNICEKDFEVGEMFEFFGRYFDASKAIVHHIKIEHKDMLEILLSNPKKYTGVTDNQTDIITMMAQGMSDKDIAKKMNVSSSTIRHGRFALREKAKQARLYLAIYELSIEKNKQNKDKEANNETIIEYHKGATMLDNRYCITMEEEIKVTKNMFLSMEPLVLKTFPAREKKKVIVLKKIIQQFEPNKHYKEKEVNAIIKSIYHDFATIRRYLVEYGFLGRTKNCSDYWTI